MMNSFISDGRDLASVSMGGATLSPEEQAEQFAEQRRAEREKEEFLAERRKQMAKESEVEAIHRAKRQEAILKEQILKTFLEANDNYELVDAKFLYDDLRKIVALRRFEEAFFAERESAILPKLTM